jgi:hypothetical protein
MTASVSNGFELIGMNIISRVLIKVAKPDVLLRMTYKISDEFLRI